MKTSKKLKMKLMFSPTSSGTALHVFMLLLDLIVLSWSIWIYWFESVSWRFLHCQTQMTFNNLRDLLEGSPKCQVNGFGIAQTYKIHSMSTLCQIFHVVDIFLHTAYMIFSSIFNYFSFIHIQK